MEMLIRWPGYAALWSVVIHRRSGFLVLQVVDVCVDMVYKAAIVNPHIFMLNLVFL